MSSINGLNTSTCCSSVTATESKIADLQRQCADWRGCPTTPTEEKEKIISALQAQIESLKSAEVNRNEIPQAHAAYDVRDQLVPTEQVLIADGVNRPTQDPLVVSGSVLNTSI
ncbi:hypothetical protein [Cellvibrio sp.]|uniref:hypothetical protein n=1 Tax=Cellvibrio sp. TaxID=1965322 RepID=UPI00396474CB